MLTDEDIVLATKDNFIWINYSLAFLLHYNDIIIVTGLLDCKLSYYVKKVHTYICWIKYNKHFLNDTLYVFKLLVYKETDN